MKKDDCKPYPYPWSLTDAPVTPIVPRFLPDDPKQRKEYPLATGCFDYFPDALAEVSRVSFLGNQQHNPGQSTHWARGKSMDTEDCLLRHFRDRGTLDRDGVRHSAKLAWRALALLQLELERELGLPLPRGAREALEVKK